MSRCLNNFKHSHVMKTSLSDSVGLNSPRRLVSSSRNCPWACIIHLLCCSFLWTSTTAVADSRKKVNYRKIILPYIFENFDVWTLSSCLSLSWAGQGWMGSQSQCRNKMMRHRHKNKTCYPSWLAAHIWRNNEMAGEDETVTV